MVHDLVRGESGNCNDQVLALTPQIGVVGVSSTWRKCDPASAEGWRMTSLRSKDPEGQRKVKFGWGRHASQRGKEGKERLFPQKRQARKEEMLTDETSHAGRKIRGRSKSNLLGSWNRSRGRLAALPPQASNAYGAGDLPAGPARLSWPFRNQNLAGNVLMS